MRNECRASSRRLVIDQCCYGSGLSCVVQPGRVAGYGEYRRWHDRGGKLGVASAASLGGRGATAAAAASDSRSTTLSGVRRGRSPAPPRPPSSLRKLWRTGRRSPGPRAFANPRLGARRLYVDQRCRGLFPWLALGGIMSRGRAARVAQVSLQRKVLPVVVIDRFCLMLRMVR